MKGLKRMANVYDKLKEKGITLPTPPAKAGVYAPVKQFAGKLLYCSGNGPHIGDEQYFGRLGKDITLEQGQKAAYNCVINLLANLHAYLGDLNKIKSIAKVLAFVASEDDFYQQPQVVNGGSQLLVDLFGEEIGGHARSAIGVNALPGNMSVEIELLVEIE